MNNESYFNKIKTFKNIQKPKNKVLGKGISALLNTQKSIETQDNQESNNYKIIEIDIDNIITGKYQPRKIFLPEALQELSISIKQKGVLQPILVKKTSENNYELIAGERRVRASKLAEIQKIPAIVVNFSNKEALEVGLIENLQREDLNPIEEALAFHKLIKEYNYTHNDLAIILGKSRSYITNYLRILNLPDDIKNLIANKKLSVGHAKIIINYECPLELVEDIVSKGLSVRNVEQLIKNKKNPPLPKKPNNSENECDISLKNKISELFNGCNITIKTNNNGAGYIKIMFKDKENLKSLILNKCLPQ